MSDAPPGEPDLIDRIADALPAEVRPDYYRELRHCKSLPENDEMLRLLRAMQFLTLLMTQVPERMASEREKLEQLCIPTTKTIQECLQSIGGYKEQLAHLPGQIAQGISPGAIAATINESLKQEFLRSTIPKVAKALTLVAERLKQTTAEFGVTAGSLTNSYRSTAEQARRAIGNMETTISNASDAAGRAVKELAWVFNKAYRWSVFTLVGLAVLIGLFLGMIIDRWIYSPEPPVKPVIQTVTPSVKSTLPGKRKQ